MNPTEENAKVPPEIAKAVHAKMIKPAKSSRKSLAKAKLALMKVMGNAVKGTDNPYFKSKYADLASVNECIQKAMQEAKVFLLIEQYPFVDYLMMSGQTDTPQVLVLTRITDTDSGEFEEHQIFCYPKEDTPQAIGSSITYLRRYSLMPIFNISPADDDGNAGSGKDQEQPKYPKNQRFKDEQGVVSKELVKQEQNLTKQPAKAQEPAKPAAATNQKADPSKEPTDEAQAAVGLISKAQTMVLKALILKHKIESVKWKAWLFANYKVYTMWNITKEYMATIEYTLANEPDTIKDFVVSDDVAH